LVKKYIEGESKEQRKARKEKEKALKEVQQEPSVLPSSQRYYILCLKHGTKYSSEYVNRLYNMVKRHCTLDFEFVCLTDDSRELNSLIKVKKLPEDLTGWWCKPYMFSNELGLNGTILYLDLDVVIANNIDKLFKHNPNGWSTIRDFTKVMRPNWDRYNSSAIKFNSGSLNYLWEDFKKNKDLIQKKFFGDQDWLYTATHQSNPATLWPDEWIQSWKWEIRKDRALQSGPKGNRKFHKIEDVVPGSECCITVFHGDPNPHNCDDPWVKTNWC